MRPSPTPRRRTVSPAKLALAAGATVAGLLGTSSDVQAQFTAPSDGNRVLGIDVSAWQSDITTTEWATFKRPTNQQVGGVSGDGRDFVFIRASRGGTTGIDKRAGGFPSGDNTTYNLSQRYDDPYFIRNITRATAAGMYAGSYHFGRADVIASTTNSGGIANTGIDEANHFLTMAGPWMRPGYLPPIFDLEAGINERTSQELGQFTLDFGNRIYEVMGIRPGIYINGSYAQDMQATNAATRTGLVNAYPVYWPARWPNQSNPGSINVQTTHPDDTVSYIYGPWDDAGQADPWQFWQYASTMRLNGNNLGASNTDVNVVHGDIEYLRDLLVPAVWFNDSSGNWATLANWNSGQAAVAPVRGPGQVAMFGSMTLPGARLPGRPDPNNAANGTNVQGIDDTVTLDRPNANITVTFDASVPTTNIRNLVLKERLNVTGSTLNVSRWGGVQAGGLLSIGGGTTTIERATFDTGTTLDFAGAGTLSVGSLVLNADVTYTGTAGTGILNGKTAGTPAINLGGGTRSFNIGDGTSATDVRIAVPIANGNINKTGAGTLELTGNNSGYTGSLNINEGYLLLTGNNQIGTQGARTNQSSQTVGGTVRLSGTNLSYSVPIILGGLGANGAGAALDNAAGNNTWSGPVLLNGANHNQGQQGLNQIGAAAGTTLTLSGVIQNNAGVGNASWAKTGAGDIVLTGGGPNAYTNLTRVFAGRLILEKDGALGAAGMSTLADGNTLQLPGAASTIAFRAPASSPAGFNYNTVEWLFTEGPGINGAQIDNLGGTNTFAGHLALGGPVVGGVQESYLGVSAGSLEVKGGVFARTQVGPEARNIFKTGPGTLLFSGDVPQTPTNASARALQNGSFTVNAGKVELKGTASDGANIPGVTSWNVGGTGSNLTLARLGAAGNASVVVNAAGTLDLLTRQSLNSITLNTGGVAQVASDGANTLRVATLAATGTGKLDLTNNDLIVTGSSLSAVQTLLTQGFNGGAWNGPGINSSAASADPNNLTTLGYISNADLGLTQFGGFTGLDANDVLVKYTYYGDADLNGIVTLDDYSLFLFGFQNPVAAQWSVGDFDYSGAVTLDDYTVFLTAFQNQGGPLGGLADAVANTQGLSEGDRAMMIQAIAAVPEPGVFGVLALAGCGIAARRRRTK